MNKKKILFIVSEDWYFVSHRINLAKYAISIGYKVAVICKSTEYKELIQKEGIIFYDWKLLRGKLNPIKNILYLKELKTTISEYKPDLMHVVSMQLVLYVGLINFFFKSRKTIYALTGLGFLYSSKSNLKKIINPIINIILSIIFRGKEANIIVQNQDDKKLLNIRNLNNNNIHIIRGGGVDIEKYNYSKEEIKNDIIVLLPARMLWSKGVQDFVNCAKQLKSNYKNVRFVLAGRLDYQNPESINKKVIEKWENNGIIEWWGNCKNMQEIYKLSSIVCLPSDREGLPKSLLEAASCGRPLISYDVPGCREIVKNNYTGLLINKDLVSLKNAIIELIENRKLRNKFGINGRQYVIKNFSQDYIFTETKKIWDI